MHYCHKHSYNYTDPPCPLCERDSERAAYVHVPIDWEPIDADTSRTKVIGGWLVQCLCQARVHYTPTYCESKEQLNLVFVPDPNHEWTV